jgi:hypothetical protein
MAEWSIATDCKSVAHRATQVRILLRAQSRIHMWKEQYERMLRSLKNIEVVYGKSYSIQDPYGHSVFIGHGDFQDSQDDVINFFKECLSLRDWIINGTNLSEADKKEIEISFLGKSSKIGLPICRDVANGSKHLTLNKSFSVDQQARMLSVGTAVILPPVSSFKLKFSVELPTKGSSIDALELARLCVQEFDQLLKNKNLL